MAKPAKLEKLVWVMELKDDKVRDYVEVHKRENVWPEILEVNRRAGVHKEEIFVFRNFVFIYLEVEDRQRMLEVFSSDPALARWNRITLPMSKARPELDSTMSELPLVFDYEEGKLLH